ncbi:hypothetical protein EH171_08080 [Enterovibrio baiacu]|nr:hypothetical protein [Enterovibrio baiacu]
MVVPSPPFTTKPTTRAKNEKREARSEKREARSEKREKHSAQKQKTAISAVFLYLSNLNVVGT